VPVFRSGRVRMSPLTLDVIRTVRKPICKSLLSARRLPLTKNCQHNRISIHPFTSIPTVAFASGDDRDRQPENNVTECLILT